MLIRATSNPSTVIRCSVLDRLALNSIVKIVFFYSGSSPQDVISQVVSDSLTDYPLFAGRLTTLKDELIIDCNNQGVELTIEQSTFTLSQIVNNITDSNEHHPLVNDIITKRIVSRDEPLLKIKVIYYQCGGMSIGYCWHHCVGDMASFMLFMKNCSNIANGLPRVLSIIPVDRDQYMRDNTKKIACNRSSHKMTALHHLNYWNKASLIYHFFFKWRKCHFVYLSFPRKFINQLKSLYASDKSLSLSSNDVLCAYVCTEMTRLFNHGTKLPSLNFAVNYRKQMQLPQHLFGNFIDLLALDVAVENSAENLSQRIRTAINDYKGQASNYYSLHELITQSGGAQRMRNMIPEPLLPRRQGYIISSWCNFGVYTINLNCGTPELVIPYGTSVFPNFVSIVENKQNNGLIFSIVLPKPIASKVRYHFKARLLECLP